MLAALGCLILAKVANIGVPLVLKQIVDSIDGNRQAMVVLPVTLLLAYGALKLGNALFSGARRAVCPGALPGHAPIDPAYPGTSAQSVIYGSIWA